jgi:hypothetical protein
MAFSLNPGSTYRSYYLPLVEQAHFVFGVFNSKKKKIIASLKKNSSWYITIVLLFRSGRDFCITFCLFVKVFQLLNVQEYASFFLSLYTVRKLKRSHFVVYS